VDQKEVITAAGMQHARSGGAWCARMVVEDVG
jgi:hypothetical protein